jgi:hypothetical protein
MVTCPCQAALFGSRWSWNPHVPVAVNALLVLDCPGLSEPKFSGGQSLWTGWGFELISCALVSLLTSVMDCPALMLGLFGAMPFALIVSVAPTDPPPGGGVDPPSPGEVGDEPPHAAISKANAAAVKLPTNTLVFMLSLRRTFARC